MTILLLAALLPAIVLLVYVYKKDRAEKEPVGLILGLFLMGACGGPVAAFAESILFEVFEAVIPSGPMLVILQYFVGVAMVEEGVKYFILRTTRKNPNFNYVFDGVVYAVAVSLGFAALENVEYVLQYGLGTGLVRAITSVPGHAIFGVFMGYYYGFAKLAEYEGDKEREQHYKRLAVVVPLLLHGTYDFFAMTMQFDGRFTILFFAFLAGLYLVGTRQVNRSAMEDRRVDPDVMQRFNPDFRPPWQE